MPTQNDHFEFGSHNVLFEKAINAKKVCLFAGYSNFADYPSYVYEYLKRIRECEYEIVFISSSPLSKTSVRMLQEHCFRIIEKENKGTDFGAWKVALSLMEFGAGLHALILANDSVFGPFRSIVKDIERLSTLYDLWGYSTSMEVNYHVQSYFLHCNSKLLASTFWSAFWTELKPEKSKELVVQNYEIGLSQKALAAKFRIGAFVDAVQMQKELKLPSGSLNFTISAWKELILKNNYPFLKKELFVKELSNSTNGGWASVLGKVFSESAVKLVEGFLEQYSSEFLTRASISHKLSDKDVIVLTHIAGRISPSQLLLLNMASQLSEVTGTPFLCYQLSNGNQYQAFGSVTDQPQFKYLGAIRTDLLEQYIYHWNKFNVKAILLDYVTFRIFRPYLENFYSGNVIVAEQDGEQVTIEYFLRTFLWKTSSFDLADSRSIQFRLFISLHSEKSFLNSPDYEQIERSADLKNVSVVWKEWANQVADDAPVEVDSLALISTPGSVGLVNLIIEYDNYSYTLIQHSEIIFFTDDLEMFCDQLQLKLGEISHDEFDIRKSLTERFFSMDQIADITDLCFRYPEKNISVSPSTSSFTHIFYEDTLYDLVPYLYTLSYLREHKYFFTISEATVNKHDISIRLKKLFPDCYIQIVKNSGKDIRGKLILLKLYLELSMTSDYLLMLHDKKSLHSWTVEGDQWRNELFRIAEPQYLFEALEKFAADQELGIVGSKKWLNNTDYDYSNGRFAFHDAFFRKKLKEYKIDIKHYEFVGGTMFWMRDALLRRFFQKYSLLDILEKLEQGNVLDSKEGTETHFLERLFGWFATSENYKLAGV